MLSSGSMLKIFQHLTGRMNTILIIVIAIIIIAGLYYTYKIFLGSSSTKSEAIPYNKEDAEKFVARLGELGYFKYAKPEDIESLKNTMVDGYDPMSELVSVWEEGMNKPKDYRYYFCDNETLYEDGGLTEMLEDLQPTFDKINLEMIVTDHTEVWDDANKWLNHSITINGTNYILFKNFPEAGWGEAVERLIQILNNELEKQNKEDRVYPVSGGNDGRIIFLSDEQFKYIDSVYKNPLWKPLRLTDWCNTMEVKYMAMEMN